MTINCRDSVGKLFDFLFIYALLRRLEHETKFDTKLKFNVIHSSAAAVYIKYIQFDISKCALQ